MKKQILQVKGAVKLTKKEQQFINGGNPVGVCDGNGSCPPGYVCIGYLCYADDGGNPNPGGGCNEPTRICELPETGCGCVYL
ncbi:hypothetical protein C8N46_106260 [Kordia periserrulae]|uniref:Uncharacterized protein n=1 Tax=Kordia periserrulae TaxID=701523 RepID=A0A2T6BX17_9FLAO|nr:hypothetical protein [Kordia periserrulae]PTX60614.1 hypothetical protein C8N46_106260 [Kordia periserrulae]